MVEVPSEEMVAISDVLFGIKDVSVPKGVDVPSRSYWALSAVMADDV